MNLPAELFVIAEAIPATCVPKKEMSIENKYSFTTNRSSHRENGRLWRYNYRWRSCIAR